MPRLLKGDIKPQNRYDWAEYFDGRLRVFTLGKDFKSVKTFISGVHQAAARMGIRALTARSGKEVRVQAVKNSKGTAKRSTSSSPRAGKRRAATRTLPRKKAVHAPTSRSRD